MTFEKKLARNLKTDVKTFWRYVNNWMKVRVPVGEPLKGHCIESGVV